MGAQRVHERSSRSWVRITLKELFSIWLGGRITSPRVWFGAGGQGVTLKLAWGPSNSSPRNLHFSFVVFFLLFSLITIFIFFYSILFFFSEKLSYCCIVLFFLVTYIRFWYFSVPFFSFPFFLILSTFNRSYHHFHVLFSFNFLFLSSYLFGLLCWFVSVAFFFLLSYCCCCFFVLLASPSKVLSQHEAPTST